MQAIVRDLRDLTSDEIATWNELLRKAPERSAFLSHAFCRAVDEVRGRVRVIIFRSEHGEVSFFPFQIRNGRSLLGHAEQVGGGVSDHFGLIGSTSQLLDPQLLLRTAGISALRFDRGIRESLPFPFLDEEEVRCVSVSVDNLSRYMDSLRSADKHFFQEVSRSSRRLEKEIGAVRFALHASDSLTELKSLMAAKSAQYRRTGVRDTFAIPWRRQMLEQLLLMPDDPLCRPMISTIHCGGKWIAANFGLLCEDILHIGYPVYDWAFRKYGPGHILFFRMIESGFASGIRKFDFGPGEAKYKLRYQANPYTRWKGTLRLQTPAGYAEQVLESCSWRIKRIARMSRRAVLH